MSLNKPIWKLRDWIDKSKLNKNNLTFNYNSIDFLKNNPVCISIYIYNLHDFCTDKSQTCKS